MKKFWWVVVMAVIVCVALGYLISKKRIISYKQKINESQIEIQGEKVVIKIGDKLKNKIKDEIWEMGSTRNFIT